MSAFKGKQNNVKYNNFQVLEIGVKPVKSHLKYALTLRSLTLYIYGAPILDVSRSHTTTQHSR